MHVKKCESFGRTALKIMTGSARWVYELRAGGFSSLKDRDGTEWIGFSPGEILVPQGAADVFRGLPNLVYPDNLGHPGYDLCRSSWTQEGDRVMIETDSHDRLWRWRWTISAIGAELDVEKVPEDRAYWFLYEGPPGGRFDRNRALWGTDRLDGTSPAPPLSNPARGSWQWAYFGDDFSPRVLSLTHVTADGKTPGLAGWMAADDSESEGMAVFGFGRTDSGGPSVPHLKGPHSFRVEFLETTDHNEIEAILMKKE